MGQSYLQDGPIQVNSPALTYALCCNVQAVYRLIIGTLSQDISLQKPTSFPLLGLSYARGPPFPGKLDNFPNPNTMKRNRNPCQTDKIQERGNLNSATRSNS